jgi:hypothetical protein
MKKMLQAHTQMKELNCQMQWQSCRTGREIEADFEEAKDGHIFQCTILLFWQ